MRFEELEVGLKRGLARPLPGPDAQSALAPRPRDGWKAGRIPEGCRVAAALLLAYPVNGEAHVVLTLRASELEKHAGQVSLPGGAVDGGETVIQSALREAEEEIAVRPDALRVLGVLTPLHIPASGFVLHPVVALADRRPRFRPEPGEVARVLEVSVDSLLDPQLLQIETQRYRSRDYVVPIMLVHGERLWGATAMVLAEFLAVLDRRPPLPES